MTGQILDKKYMTPEIRLLILFYIFWFVLDAI